MMVSPKAGAAASDKFGANPVCAGPYKFRRASRRRRSSLEKFEGYWNKAAIAHRPDRVRPRARQRRAAREPEAGGFDIIERVPPTDAPAIAPIPTLKLVESPSTLGYDTLSINLNGTVGATAARARTCACARRSTPRSTARC